MGYGFCIDKNPEDYVMIKIALSENDPLYQDKKILLKKKGLNMLHALKRGHVPPSLLSALRICVMTPFEIYFAEEGQINWPEDATDRPRKKNRVQERKNQMACDSDSFSHGWYLSILKFSSGSWQLKCCLDGIINLRNELEMISTLADLVRNKLSLLGESNSKQDKDDQQRLAKEVAYSNTRNAITYKIGM